METLTVAFTLCDGSASYLAFDYEGDEVFPALSGYCEAKEFGSVDAALEGIELAKRHGLKFFSYEIVPI